MEKYLLIKFDADWADEFSVYGVWFSTLKEYESLVKGINKYFSICSYKKVYFGTNEALEFTTAEEVLNCITPIEISKSTYLEMNKKLGNFGGISFDWLDEEEDDE